MGADPPFLYDNPAKFSFTAPSDRGFNPRAATQASWAPPKVRPRQEGPLIDAKEFNRHPDSYLIVPYGNLNWKPMSPRTKVKVKYVRWAQLLFRILSLAGAIGMLVCVICIKGTQGTEGWIIRVPPGVAILNSTYAIHHLSRSAKRRTPGSSASYMIFAAIVDTCLIPFFVFTSMISRNQYVQSTNTEEHWKTLFDTADATSKIIYSTFLVSTVNGGFHLVSLIISIYLAVIFRKISKLPPDMNPLEDNLTSRHKRNKSSLFVDKRMSQNTTTTVTNRSKAEDPLIVPPRTVPFLHTRDDSFENVPRPQSTPRVSRTDLPTPFYTQLSSKQSSHINTNPTRPLTSSSSIYTDDTRAGSIRPQSTLPPFAHHRSPSPTIEDESENWTTHPSPPPSPFEFKHLRTPYQPVPQSIPVENESLLPRPLAMNPPTPPVNQAARKQYPGHRALGPGSGNTMGLGVAVSTRQRAYEGLGSEKIRSTGRVVSRTGVEVKGLEGVGKGMRAREVSGKVAEEGRGDRMWRERSGMI